MTSAATVPPRAWMVTAAGMAVNLCLGILYAWSVWKGELVPADPALYGTPMGEKNTGWTYLSDAQGTWAYAICGFTFALFMIPGGRIQDRYGPKTGATLGGLSLASGCIIAGLMKSYLGLILGFGILGGIGMGLGYAAATPAAVKWFHSSRRGPVVGLVVAGYAAAILHPPRRLSHQALRSDRQFRRFGALCDCGRNCRSIALTPPPDTSRPPSHIPDGPKVVHRDFAAHEMLRTWQFYALVFLSSVRLSRAYSSLRMQGLMKNAADATGFSRPTRGCSRPLRLLSTRPVALEPDNTRSRRSRECVRLERDHFGRVSLAPWVIAEKNVWLLFLVIGVMFLAVRRTLALMPAITADYYGAKNLGLNYGLVFIGWGVAFFVPQLAGYIKDETGS